MDVNTSNQPTNPSVTTAQSPLPEHPVKKQRGFFSIILGFIAILVVVAGGAYYLGTKSNTTTSQTPIATTAKNSISTSVVPTQTEIDMNEWKTYKNEGLGLELKYPQKLKIKQEKDVVTFNHSIPYKNSGDCDMMGGSDTYDTLTDFNISVEILPHSVTPDVIDGTLTIGALNGQWVLEGAEGCGDTLYYFPIQGTRTLLVRRANIQALSGISTVWNREEILKVPGVITQKENENIFKQMLSTIEFRK